MRALWTASSCRPRRSARLSATPRRRVISAGGRARVGSGRRARLPARPEGPGWNATCTSLLPAIARTAPAVARLKSSVRELSLVPLMFAPERASAGTPRQRACRDLLVEAALVVLRHRAPFRLVAFVEE